MGTQHLPMGFGASVLVSEAAQLQGQPRLVFVALGTAAALLPDVDHKGTHANRALFGNIDLIPGHRGWTHSLVGSAILGAVTALIVWLVLDRLLWNANIEIGPLVLKGMVITPAHAWLIASATAFGCFVHLLGDWVTVTGVPWLWPLSRERHSLKLLTTGGGAGILDRVKELVLAYGFTVGCLLWAWAWSQ